MKKVKRGFIIAIIVIALITSTALAITIIVDGTREAAWNGGGSQTDPNEAAIAAGVDIVNVEWTNSVTTFYFLFETQGATTWDIAGSSDPYITLCINNDNNTGTGTALDCLGSGYDRYVEIFGPTPGVNVYENDNFTLIPTAITQVAYSGRITELAIDMASLGLNATTNCNTMPVGLYFDGQTAAIDDRVLDSGDIIMNCGTPTAVTLQNAVSGDNLSGLMTITLILIPALSLITTGIYLYHRKQRHLV